MSDLDIRAHLTGRLNRARLRLELKRSARPLIVVGVGVLVGLACAFYVARNVARSTYTPSREISFALDDASGLIGGGRQELRFKGISAGSIQKVALEHGRPVATAKLYRSLGPVYRDARATLRPNTALEDVYIDIVDRGTKRAGELPSGTPLAARDTATSVQAEDVLNALRPDVREHMATILDQLGNGMQDRGAALRTAFVRLGPFVELAGRLSHQLAHRSDLTRRLVSDTSDLTAELGRRDRELRTLVRTAGTTLTTLDERSPDLDATLRELPPTLAVIDSSFAALRRVLPDVDGAVTSLRPVAVALPSSLRGLRRLSSSLDPAVRSLRTPVRQLVPFANTLVPASDLLRRSVDALRPQTRAIDHVTRSVKGCTVALEGFFQWTASLVKLSDARGGPPGRGDLNLGLDSLGANSDPNQFVGPSCAPGVPIAGTPGTGGDLKP